MKLHQSYIKAAKIRIAEIIQKAIRTEKGCLIPKRGTSKAGYHVVTINGVQFNLHRLIYFIANPDLPDNQLVRHSCDNRACIELSHLIEGTHKDNSQDMVVRNRNPKGSQRYGSKLTEKDIPSIRDDPRYCYEIAAEYGVSADVIARVKRREIWRHV